MKILVLAGGADQAALINELKRRGHSVILLDYYDNPPARAVADKHIVASTLDVAKVRETAVEEQVDLITTACTDQALLTVANVSEQLVLPCYLSYQTGLNVTNKSYMKKVLQSNGIPTAKFVIVDKVDLSAVKDFTFPLVVKPVDCNSSKGVRRVDNIEELPVFLAEAIEFSRTKTAVIEEYISGQEVSVDYWVEGDKARLLSATSSLKMKNKDSFTILCSDYPAVNSEVGGTLEKIGNDVAKAFGLRDCPLLIQMIVDGEKVHVIEFSARMGGGSKYHLIKVISGVDIMSKYVDLVLGDKPSVRPARAVEFCKMIYVYCRPGVIRGLSGFEEMKEAGIIDTYFRYKTDGMEIEKAVTSGDRAAGYLISSDSAEGLAVKLKYADEHLKVISDGGIDIMMHGQL